MNPKIPPNDVDPPMPVRVWIERGLMVAVFVAPWFIFRPKVAAFIDGALALFGFAVGDILDKE